ncbi:OsmC family protein [Inquilinus sp. CA228]|uniref:OsmC family protein n=1 Tax=Inquilinus sp. CA228 TaxID=3455609 RepID=UPI003F8D394B
MDRDAGIRAAQERVAEVFRRKPDAALSTIRASGRLDQGLVCRVRQGDHEAVMDMGKVIGGDGSAPTPGFFIRAGLAGCVAIGIKLTAARESIPVESIDVDVEMDFDDGALLGVGSNPAAPLETRITVALRSAAPWEVIEAMVARALAADPYYLALRDAQSVKVGVVPAGA